MDPYVNNFLDDSSSSHSRLMNCLSQPFTPSPFREAAALDPHATVPNIPQSLVDGTQYNSGGPFLEATALDPHSTIPNITQHLLDDAKYNTGGLFLGATALDTHATIPNITQPLLDDGKYNTCGPFLGAATVDPNAAHSYTTHSSQNETPQTGFLKALQLPPSTHENPDDVSTWSINTIWNVATDLSNNNPELLFDCEAQCVADNPETAPVCDMNNNDSDDKVVGVYKGMIYEPEPCNDDPTGTSQAPLRPGSEHRRRRVMMYELPPQSDPKKEKQRLRAVRQRQRREQEKKEVQELQKDLHETKTEMAKLAIEVSSRQGRVQWLEQLVALRGCSLGLI